MGGNKKTKSPPPPPPASPAPTIDTARQAQDEGDRQLRRRGRDAYLFSGPMGEANRKRALLGGA